MFCYMSLHTIHILLISAGSMSISTSCYSFLVLLKEDTLGAWWQLAERFRFDFILGKVCVNLVDDQNSQADFCRRCWFLRAFYEGCWDFCTSLESLESPHGIIALSIWPCCEALQELLCVGPKAIRSCCMVLLGSWNGVVVGKGRTGRWHSWDMMLWVQEKLESVLLLSQSQKGLWIWGDMLIPQTSKKEAWGLLNRYDMRKRVQLHQSTWKIRCFPFAAPVYCVLFMVPLEPNLKWPYYFLLSCVFSCRFFMVFGVSVALMRRFELAESYMGGHLGAENLGGMFVVAIWRRESKIFQVLKERWISRFRFPVLSILNWSILSWEFGGDSFLLRHFRMVVGSLGVEVMMLTLKIRQIYIYIYIFRRGWEMGSPLLWTFAIEMSVTNQRL